MTLYAINSIYRATEGEGVHLGTPQVFVRYQGCAIGCINCDSIDTWAFTEQGITLEELIVRVETEACGLKRVSITGGDPLHPQHVPGLGPLIKAFKSRGYYINLEAAGTRVLPEVFDAIDFISYDYKTPSTGVRTPIHLLEKLIDQFPGKFQIKSVVQDYRDFEAALAALKVVAGQREINFPWVLTPCYNLGEPFPAERFRQIIAWNQDSGGPFRVIGQQHKWFFGPDRKQV